MHIQKVSIKSEITVVRGVLYKSLKFWQSEVIIYATWLLSLTLFSFIGIIELHNAVLALIIILFVKLIVCLPYNILNISLIIFESAKVNC